MADSDLPVKASSAEGLDRGMVERVLARAAELQGSHAEDSDAERMSEAQLVEIAKEVGLDPMSVRQAIAEERTRVALGKESGWAARSFGPGRVSARRNIQGAADEVLVTLDRWMQREESLQLQRRFPDRLVWEPRTGIVGMVRRGLGVGGRRYELAKAGEVYGTVVALDATHTLVCVEADMTDRRNTRLRTAGGVAGVGALAAGTIALLAVAVPAVALFPLAAAGAVAWMVARGHRDAAVKMQIALERALDRVEFGDVRSPLTLAGALGAAARPLLR